MKPFNAVVAPSCSRPQISMDHLRADLLQAKELMGESGVAGFTEISHGNAKALFSSVFGWRIGLRVSDCPIVWTADFTKLDGGTDFGAAAIRIVAPIRRTCWAELRRADGLTVGAVAVHMHPGGWARRPSRAQVEERPTIRLRWKRHARRIQRRVDWLAARCDVVVVMGDINYPHAWTWQGIPRDTAPGLLYLGARFLGRSSHVALHKQHADHPAAVVTITPKEHR